MSDSAQKPQKMSALTAEEALARLSEGNRRYVADETVGPNRSQERRLDVAKGQEPFAVILACSDSRVPPELIFDQGLGDLFVVRTAGHVMDNAVLSSIRFAVTRLRIPLVMVLGHQRCGAVEAALAAVADPVSVAADLAPLLDGIRPAAEQVNDRTDDRLDHAVRAHVVFTVGRLQQDPVLAQAVAEGQLRIVGACYDLDTGRVEIIAP
jgi:carbonic anhydrase